MSDAEDGLEGLVSTRGLALTRFAYVLCGDAHLADDLVQTAFERTLVRWRRAGVADRPEAYLRRVIVREFISLRRRRSASEVRTPSPPDTAQVSQGDTAGTRDVVWRHLTALPARQRAVLVLRYYEDLDDTAIAGLIGSSRSTVRSLASRAIAALRTTTLQVEVSE